MDDNHLFVSIKLLLLYNFHTNSSNQKKFTNNLIQIFGLLEQKLKDQNPVKPVLHRSETRKRKNLQPSSNMWLTKRGRNTTTRDRVLEKMNREPICTLLNEYLSQLEEDLNTAPTNKKILKSFPKNHTVQSH